MTEVTETGELIIEREFDAPRDLVWRAWTDPDHFARWYGPEGFTISHCAFDLRVGGALRICMSHPQYGDKWTGGAFDVVDPPSRLAYREYMTDADGNRRPSPMPGWPDEVLTSLEFTDLGADRTKLTMTWGVPAGLASETGALAAWNQALDKLAAYLPRLAMPGTQA